jgi:hypothetical protein
MAKKKSSVKTLVKRQSTNRLDVIGTLNDWAHAGTKESMANLEKFIADKKNTDEKLRGHAECALDECQYFYYCPNNPAEEKEFLLAKMIYNEEERLMNLEIQLDAAKYDLEKLDLNREVNHALMKTAEAEKHPDFKYRFSEDYYMTVKNRHDELLEDIRYSQLWLEAAAKMIKSEKYKNMPESVAKSIVDDSEGVNIWTNDPFEDDDNCDCGEDCCHDND